jgi:UDP-glucose 4-epimerase
MSEGGMAIKARDTVPNTALYNLRDAQGGSQQEVADGLNALAVRYKYRWSCAAQTIRPTNPYGESKLAAERLIAWQAQTGRLKATVLRCFNIAGGFDGLRDPDTTRIIPKTLAVANGEFDHVTVNGDGSALGEYTHVLDVAEAFRLAVEVPCPDDRPHRVYNVGTGLGISVADVIAHVRQLTGNTVAVEHADPKPEPAVLVADSSLLEEELGWSPHLSTLDRILSDGWATHRSTVRT